MKPLVKFFLSLASFLLMTGIAAGLLHAKYNINPFATLAISIVLAFAFALLPKRGNGGGMHMTAYGVENEFWVNYIIERLWKDNMFLKHAYSDDQYVVGGKIVHIPQPGSKPVVVKGRTSFPATAVRRTDTEISYVLEEYSTDPTHIQDAEKLELSYSKIDSVLGDHAGALNEVVAEDMIIKWLSLLPSTGIVETSGAAVDAKVTGQTGQRKGTVHTDLKRCGVVMDLANIPKNDRFAMFEANMLDELVNSLSATQYRDFSQYFNAETGVLGKLYNFNILDRSSVAMSAAALNGSSQLVVNALGAATAATDQVTSMVWQKNAIARALGEVKFFERLNDPLFFGDVYSANLRMGGRRRRADNAGVIALRQATAA